MTHIEITSILCVLIKPKEGSVETLGLLFDIFVRDKNTLYYGGVNMRLIQSFQTRVEAEWAADKLINKVQETLNEYGSVRVTDVYDFMYDITGSMDFINESYTNSKYGWTEDPCIYVYHARNYLNSATYGLELSDPKLLEIVKV